MLLVIDVYNIFGLLVVQCVLKYGIDFALYIYNVSAAYISNPSHFTEHQFSGGGDQPNQSMNKSSGV